MKRDGHVGGDQRWRDAAVSKLKSELDVLLGTAGTEIPTEPGGWWHQYVCPAHHAELEFDARAKDAEDYRCPHGCVLTEEKYRGAWLVYKHQELARTALTAAFVHAETGEARYCDAALRIIAGYARQYPLYPTHPGAEPWMLKGRAFHQALTEAIWSTTLLRAWLLLKRGGAIDSAAEEAVAEFLGLLESSMSEYRQILIRERKQPESNYTAWLNACLACVYAVRGERRGMEALIDGEGGLREHLTIGVHADQFEYEGSTYYHVFVLRAYFIAAEMAESLGYDLSELRGDQGQSYRGMLQALVGIAAPDGRLPALHDGPYERQPFAREIAEVFETGYRRYRESRYVPILREAYWQLYGKPVRQGLEALLYGADAWEVANFADTGAPESTCFEQTGFAVGRLAANRLSFLVDYGPHGGSHGHDDKLNLVLMHERGFVAPERGMVPYGSALRKEWFAQTPSHNTVTVGGRTQAHHAGRCVQFAKGEASTYAWLRSEGAYPGAVLDRHLLLTSEWLLDWFVVTLEQEDVIDWWWHALHPIQAASGGMGTCSSSQHLEGLPEPSSAYGFVKTLTSLRCSNRSIWSWTTDGVSGSLLIEPGAELMLIDSPGTSVDPSIRMDGILYRQRGRTAHFIAVYRDGEAPIRLERAQGDPSQLLLATTAGTDRVELSAAGLRFMK